MCLITLVNCLIPVVPKDFHLGASLTFYAIGLNFPLGLLYIVWTHGLFLFWFFLVLQPILASEWLQIRDILEALDYPENFF